MSEFLIFEHYPFPNDANRKNWATVPLNAVVKNCESGFPSGRHNAEGRGIPHIRPMNITRSGNLTFEETKYIDEACPKLLANGDVLFNNTNSPDLIGKTTVIEHSQVLAFSNHMTRLSLEAGVNPRFVAAQLHALWMFGYFKHRCVNHVNQASISSDPLLRTVPFLLAPTNEQSRIADMLDELLFDLDAGVHALKRARAKLQLYRASVLKAAVTGELTAKWRASHPATETGPELLRRILVERRRLWEQAQLAKFEAAGKTPPANWKFKYKEPVALDAKALHPLPQGWCWATFDQICWSMRSGTAITSSRVRTDYPVLKSSAVRPGSVDFEDVNFLSVEQSLKSDCFLEAGDLLITRLSGSLEYVANCAVVGASCVSAVQFPDRIFQAKSVSSVNRDFVCACFQHPKLRKHFEDAAKSTAGHQRISLSDLKSFPLPIPPIVEEELIADLLLESLSNVEHELDWVDKRLELATALRQSCLRHAFTGRLVPQDDNDEPAHVLLDRIAAERAERRAATRRKMTSTRQKRKPRT